MRLLSELVEHKSPLNSSFGKACRFWTLPTNTYRQWTKSAEITFLELAVTLKPLGGKHWCTGSIKDEEILETVIIVWKEWKNEDNKATYKSKDMKK